MMAPLPGREKWVKLIAISYHHSYVVIGDNNVANTIAKKTRQ